MSQIKSSINDSSISKKPESARLTRLRETLKDIRALQETKLAEGVNGIERYVEEIEGDWLENWDDQDYVKPRREQRE